MKDKQEVIRKFNEQVNMSAEELRDWLDSPESRKAGTGVGIESGNKIVEILKRNPDMDPGNYTEEDIEHMRRVVSYNSRHLAQEDHLKETKTPGELEKTKSTISLRNWGHDPMKELKRLKHKESRMKTNTKHDKYDKAEQPPQAKKAKLESNQQKAQMQGLEEQPPPSRRGKNAGKGETMATDAAGKPARRNPPRQAKRTPLTKE